MFEYIGRSYIQGIASAAASQGKTVKEMLFQQRQRAFDRKKTAGLPGCCFNCGPEGHYVKQCPNKVQNNEMLKEPNLCPRSEGGKHWTSDYSSQRDVQGNILPGNCYRGQPQALN